jgi:hypothetical protein
MHNERNKPAGSATPGDWIHLVTKQVSTLRYGVVQIVVHDSQIVQVERMEKFRLNPVRVTSDSSNAPTGYPEAIQQLRPAARLAGGWASTGTSTAT